MAIERLDDEWSRDARPYVRDWTTARLKPGKVRERGRVANTTLIFVLMAAVSWLGTIAYHLLVNPYR